MSAIEDIYALSALQEGMLFHGLAEPQGGLYVEQLHGSVAGHLDVAAFRASWDRIAERHPVLRTAVVSSRPDRPLQVVHRRPPLPWVEEDWRGLGAAGQEARLEAHLAADRARGFDVTKPPLMRFALFRTSDDTHRFVWTFHHLLLDGWSTAVVLAELEEVYRATRRGREAALGPTAPYRAYVAWLRAQDRTRTEAYWRARLEGLTGSTRVPPDRDPGSSIPTGSDAQRAVTLSAASTACVAAFARAHQVTLHTLVLGAWALVLSRATGERDVLFGSTVSVRPPEIPAVEGMVGLLVNTLAVRAAVPPRGAVVAWLRDLQQEFLEALAFGHASLTDVHGWSAVPRGTALVDSLVVLENYPERGEPAEEDLQLEVGPLHSVERTSFPVALVVTPGDRLGLRLDVDSRRYLPSTAERVLGWLVRVLEAVTADPEIRLEEVSLLTEAERSEIVKSWSGRRTAYPREGSLGTLFEEQARLHGERIALEELEEGDRRWSYREVEAASRGVALRLRALGIGAESRVGLWMERSAEMVVGMLGIVRAGAAYVPLDPGYPEERLRWMAQDAGVEVVVGTASGAVPFAAGVRMVPVSGALETEGREDLDGGRVHAEGLAYVMYTSGTTGWPKGVGATHRGVVRLVQGADYARFGPEETWLQLSPISFDASVLEIWGSLLHGSRLVLMPPGAPSLAELREAVERHAVTSLWLTAPLFHQVVDEGLGSWKGLRHLLAGGDVLGPRQVERARRELPGCRLVNGYGPTEGTTFTCCEVVEEDDFAGRTVPIGRPIANTRVHVLDERMEPVPVGVEGELYAGGDGLARGYLGDPDLTAERFVPDPFSEAGGERLYRTGDRVRWLADGRIEFLGRRDAQLKVRGYRIEAGEVEAALLREPGVREAAVAARGDGLVAYVVATEGARVEEKGLRAALRQRLPEPMVPSTILGVPELPKTPSGKVDRKALPEPHARPAGRGSTPQGAVEEVVAGIWARVLGVEAVGREDEFFALGGHSLLATQVISRVREALGIELPMRWLFETPALGALAERIEGLRSESAEEAEGTPRRAAPPIVRVPREGRLPLSFAQERLWFLDQLDPGSAAYHVPIAVRLTGRLDAKALERALGEVVRRHEVLRTRFAVEEDRPVQVIGEETGVALAAEDWSERWSGEERRGGEEGPRGRGDGREDAVEARIAEEAARPFDLARGPLVRALLLRLSAREHVLVLVLHHVVADGWSLGVLVREVTALYGAYLRDEASPLPEPDVQYADYAVWQRRWLSGGRLAGELAYWKERLAGAPPVHGLPTDRPRPPVRGHRGARHLLDVPERLAAAVEAFARREGATPFMVLLAAFDVLLHRYGGATDVVVGTPVAGRTRREIEDPIGLFVNTLVLRTDLSGDPSFRETVRRVRETALGAHAHQDVPFERLVEELQPERDLGHTPLFQVLFDLQNAPMPALALEGLQVRSLDVPVDTAQVDLSVSLARADEGMVGSIDFDRDLFDPATIERMAGHFLALLQAGLADPAGRISRLPLLSAEERRRLLTEWNRPPRPAQATACLHERFHEQAARTPGAIAVTCGESAVAYGELAARSSALARRLRAAGVVSETKVALLLDRSIEMVVAILGTLEAGGAYVPLDPAQGGERLAYVLEDSGAAVVLTRRSMEDRVPSSRAPALCVDADGPPFPLEWDHPPDAGPLPRPQSCAYVIYTSGSTGRPKGVAVAHASVVRIFEETREWFSPAPADTWSLFHSFAFDVSVWEMWGALLHGGRLVIVPEDARRDPEAFRRLLEAQGVTVLCQTPSSFRALDRADGASGASPLPALRLVIFAGEPLDPRSLRPWLARYGDDRPRLVNMYGITETTIHASYRRMTWRDLEPGTGSRIGVPIPDLRIHLLDPRLELVPVGVTGEIFVGGPGLARGYLGRPDLTAERFVPDPHASSPGERLYRSGDLARRLPDGDVEFLGRADHQLKIRGFRVEPAEIEAALLEHAAVREAIVVLRSAPTGPEGLVAYLIGTSTGRPGPPELRAFAASRLPDYMVPASFVWLDAWPTTPNGKLDRGALPEPDRDAAGAASAFVAPATAVEEIVASIWREVLALDRVGAHDDFFELGGHSLLATQVLHRLRDVFRTDLSLRALFEAPTVAGLAHALAASEPVPGLTDRVARLWREVDGLPDGEVERLLSASEPQRDPA